MITGHERPSDDDPWPLHFDGAEPTREIHAASGARSVTYLVIEHLDDALAHGREGVGIKVNRHARYTVIDYAYVSDDLFESAWEREFRGLKFDADGRPVARPFHKFFNWGERLGPDMDALDWSRPHVVMEKLDGSMVHPVVLDGDLVFMTRAGITPQAEAALALASARQRDWAREASERGITPILEFTAPGNRIVVAYGEPALTLLAAREMRSGRYLTQSELHDLAGDTVPLVQAHDPVDDPVRFLADARARQGVEGYVIAFEDGTRIKVKADGYVLRHKALSALMHEKNVAAFVLEGAVDDVLPLVSPHAAGRLAAYRDAMETRMDETVARAEAFHAEHGGLERRDYAERVRETFDKRLMGLAFAAADGRDTREVLHKVMRGITGSASRIEANLDLLPPPWIVDFLDLREIEG